MTERSSLYGVATVAIAVIIVSASVGAFYYFQYSYEISNNEKLVRELNDSGSAYAGLASNYNGLLSKYNESVSLLSRSISVMNTSERVYGEASRELSALWQEYLALKPASTTLLHNDVLIEFENGSRTWFNNTAIQPGWNLYVETVVLTKGNMGAQWFPQYGSHLVKSLFGASSTQTKFWFVWSYNQTTSWQLASAGSDQLIVFNASQYAWTLCGVDQSFNPTCKP
ncbi:MAG: hypothetical protein OK422_02910 [Thaumarchaeota archaeon]|nr:hypothetical protein [Nitrososphaerota archaeon]